MSRKDVAQRKTPYKITLRPKYIKFSKKAKKIAKPKKIKKLNVNALFRRIRKKMARR